MCMKQICKNSDPFFWNILQDKETFKCYISQLEVILNQIIIFHDINYEVKSFILKMTITGG